MDEPLSNLDAKLRVQMRTEVSRIQQRLGTTTVYVTHDQTEAMTLGDRVAVMRSGELQQVGDPMTLYNEPVNLFVAGFIGSPAMNFMPAAVEGDTVKLPIGDVRLPPHLHERIARHEGKQLIAGVRPEAFEAAELTGEARDRGMTFNAHIDVVESMGSELYAHFTVDSDQTIESAELRELAEDAGGGEVPSAGEEGRIVARLDPASKVTEGQDAELWVDATRLMLFDPEDGRNLTTDKQGPAATGGQGTSGREPEGEPRQDDARTMTGSGEEPRPGATGGQR
jgi:multiple sugar transport system ATP-binding protein